MTVSCLQLIVLFGNWIPLFFPVHAETLPKSGRKSHADDSELDGFITHTDDPKLVANPFQGENARHRLGRNVDGFSGQRTHPRDRSDTRYVKKADKTKASENQIAKGFGGFPEQQTNVTTPTTPRPEPKHQVMKEALEALEASFNKMKDRDKRIPSTEASLPSLVRRTALMKQESTPAPLPQWLSHGWPPPDTDSCKEALRGSWKVVRYRLERWQENIQSSGVRVDETNSYMCCGYRLPYDHKTSYSMSGRGCLGMITNTNFMDVLTLVAPLGQLSSSVSSGNWYAVIDMYGKYKYPDGRGKRYYPDYRWNTPDYNPAKVNAHHLGLDSFCTEPHILKYFHKGILKHLEGHEAKPYIDDEHRYIGAYAWQSVIDNVILKRAGIDPTIPYGRLVPTHEWPEQVCSDWAPGASIIKGNYETGYPDHFRVFTYNRHLGSGSFFNQYKDTPIGEIIADLSTGLFRATRTFLTLTVAFWEDFCIYNPKQSWCVTHPHDPPDIFYDIMDVFKTPGNPMSSRGKKPFVLQNTESDWDCHQKSHTLAGRFQRMLNPRHAPCYVTDGILADDSGFLANIVARELQTAFFYHRRLLRQAKIFTLQSKAELHLLRTLLGHKVTAKDGTDLGVLYGEKVLKAHTGFHEDISEQCLEDNGMAFFLAYVQTHPSLSLEGDYSILLHFTSLNRGVDSNAFLQMLPEDVQRVSMQFNFPELPVWRFGEIHHLDPFKEYVISYPPPVANALSIYAERISIMHLGVMRWSDLCWGWLNKVSQLDWFADAMCFCLSAPMKGTPNLAHNLDHSLPEEQRILQTEKQELLDPLGLVPWFANKLRRQSDLLTYWRAGGDEDSPVDSKQKLVEFLFGNVRTKHDYFKDKSQSHRTVIVDGQKLDKIISGYEWKFWNRPNSRWCKMPDREAWDKVQNEIENTLRPGSEMDVDDAWVPNKINVVKNGDVIIQGGGFSRGEDQDSMRNQFRMSHTGSGTSPTVLVGLGILIVIAGSLMKRSGGRHRKSL